MVYLYCADKYVADIVGGHVVDIRNCADIVGGFVVDIVTSVDIVGGLVVDISNQCRYSWGACGGHK